MAPVIWGLDLAEIKWSKFGNSYMWNKEYHLRRTKFIVYQLALIFCVVSESLGTAVLSDYIDGQAKVQKLTDRRQKVYNNDYVGAASYNIFAGVFVAFIFGAAFFFDLIWPERKESRGVRVAWKVCGVLAVIFHLASALTLTIITAMHRSYMTPAGPAQEARLWDQYKKHGEAPLIYRHNPRAIAAVVFAWLGTASVIPSCILLFLSIDNSEKGPGPKSKHAREHDALEEGSDPESREKSVQEPELAYAPATRTDESPYVAPAADNAPSYESGR